MKAQFNTVAITGAGSGLGRATALAFARQGWAVAVADINSARGEETLAEINALNAKSSNGSFKVNNAPSAFYQHCDVSSEDDIRALHDRCLLLWGGIGVLINNAGVASSISAIDRTNADEWQRVLDINLSGVVRGCAIFSQTFKQQKSGHIVNIASIAGITCTPGMTVYNTAKAAVIALSETLRWELKAKNIGVTVVCPALFKTNLTESIRNPREGEQAMLYKAMAESSISVDDIASKIVAAVKANQFMLLPHKHSWPQWWLKRLSPDLYQWFYAR